MNAERFLRSSCVSVRRRRRRRTCPDVELCTAEIVICAFFVEFAS